jgi:hypothetical protein
MSCSTNRGQDITRTPSHLISPLSKYWGQLRLLDCRKSLVVQHSQHHLISSHLTTQGKEQAAHLHIGSRQQAAHRSVSRSQRRLSRYVGRRSHPISPPSSLSHLSHLNCVSSHHIVSHRLSWRCASHQRILSRCSKYVGRRSNA